MEDMSKNGRKVIFIEKEKIKNSAKGVLLPLAVRLT